MRPNPAEMQTETPAQKLWSALQMYDDGVAMMRLRLVRQFGEEEGLKRLETWLRSGDDDWESPEIHPVPAGR
jgi:hypothetical protein